MTCRPTETGYLLDGEHYDECEDQACKGCWPCVPTTEHGDPLGHCTARGRCTEHVPAEVLSCPRCVGEARKILADIELKDTLMLDEAVAKGVDSEAANLAGPAADPWAMQYRALSAMAGRIPPLEDESKDRHPMTVLGWWEMALAEDYGHDRTERITVASAVAYIDGQLDRLAQDPEQDFPLFVREIADCRAHLDAVLHDQRGSEKGAPCPACPTPAPKLMLRHSDRDKSGASDRWHCPAEKDHSWSDAEYRLRVSNDYLNHADRLTARQIAKHWRLKEGSIRGWAAKECEDGTPLVRKRGTNGEGLTLYDVADVLAVRDKSRVAAKRDMSEAG